MVNYELRVTSCEPERRPCRIVVGDALPLLDEILPRGRRVVIITDHHVFALYGDEISRREHIVIPTGEAHKTLETVGEIYSRLVGMSADRTTFIVGFGGGIVTDIAGFVASTYLRGVDFGFVATSLMGQVDASVGGKNGVNVLGYKNMAGTFRQPDFVLCDTAVLQTLPPREFRAGLAEMIKAGIIGDPQLFELLEAHSPEEFLADRELLTRAIAAAIKVKVDIVERDEREGGERRKLNLGHTFAHAIEHLTGEYVHGEAVAVGLVAAAGVSLRRDLLSAADHDRIVSVIRRAGLPVATDIPRGEALRAMTRDKKAENDCLWIVLPRRIGEVELRRTGFGELTTM
jgi:3-dehydroquinate synthase